jgi:transposase-like protein
MLSTEDWQRRTVAEGIVRCPGCDSDHVSFGACAVGAYTIFQEYVCEACQLEFQAMFGLIGYSPGTNDDDTEPV